MDGAAWECSLDSGSFKFVLVLALNTVLQLDGKTGLFGSFVRTAGAVVVFGGVG